MYRLSVMATSLLLATSAFAGQPASAAPPAAASALVMPGAPAASDKVYPPLPTLAMLPPNSADEHDLQPKRSQQRKKKSRIPDRKSVAPFPDMVVSHA